MSVHGEATWFRSGDRSLEGWVHRPEDGRAIGALLVAGEFAHEALVTYRALRTLAISAAERGWVVVRFSWSGTGDSEPIAPENDLISAWQEDLASAAALARSASGLPDVDAAGLRIGGAILASATHAPIRTRLLWEPVGGRDFLRQQSALLRMHLPSGFPAAPRGVELANLLLSEEQAASVRRLSDPRDTPDDLPEGTHLVLEANAETAIRLYDIEPVRAEVPMATVHRMLDLLPLSTPTALPVWAPEREAIVTDRPSGTRIRKTFVDIGPERLPGIYTEPLQPTEPSAAALLVALGVEPKGVNRNGPAASRRLAVGGVPSLRADPRGIGDAPAARRGVDLEGGVGDVARLASWLAERAAVPVTTVGLCAGAWLAARAAARSPMRRVILVNTGFWHRSGAFYKRAWGLVEPPSPGEGPERDSPTGASIPPRSTDSKWQRLRRRIRWHSPYAIRYRIYARAERDEIAEILLREIPADTITRIHLGVDTDRAAFYRARGERSVQRLAREGRDIEVVWEPGMDHSLFTQSALDAYMTLLEREFELPRAAVTSPQSAS